MFKVQKPKAHRVMCPHNNLLSDTALPDGVYATKSPWGVIREVEVLLGKIHLDGVVLTQAEFFSVNEVLA